MAPDIVRVLEHTNVGVVTSVVSLLIGLATTDPPTYQECVGPVIKLLDQVKI